MKISLDALLVLDAIDRNGSFAAAADELHRVTSAVSYVIQKLEQDLDVQLFDRSGHRARLTAAGQVLLRDGRNLLDAARTVEHRLLQQAAGWESELVITIGDLVPFEQLIPLIARFDQLGSGTQLRFTREVFGGIWDALYDARADLVLGAPGHPPAGDYFHREIGSVDFVFLVSPQHPLAAAPEPLAAHTLRQHRIISLGDTSRRLPTRTAGILNGQDVLTVHTLDAKLALMIAGLGIGYLPRMLAAPYLQNGQLVEKSLKEKRSCTKMFYAWKEESPGKALAWFIDNLALAIQQQQLII
ncbi:LysR family transcriptional regulator [Aquitalea aquatica]|uniref:LysR family transcriptional regulator n=1 Tax=Aquitalea aquatica TaxID=3044273 RepID=A0A838YE34_9NEIS|nr:LysR family transcriptional regulator [Aquitalea magnusonii]MBA4708881.1 LysR family transcriptional regulator [Aquitalea magnusonii]